MTSLQTLIIYNGVFLLGFFVSKIVTKLKETYEKENNSVVVPNPYVYSYNKDGICTIKSTKSRKFLIAFLDFVEFFPVFMFLGELFIIGLEALKQ